MKQLTVLALFVLLAASVALAADKGSVEEYRDIIEQRCTACHDADRIERAMMDKQNVDEVLNKMQKMGAELTPRDKDVLGIFWGSPLKEKK